jgi:hypothetical protein
MSVTVFLAICILSFDFLLYVLFQWIYGEKRRERSRRQAARPKSGSILSDLDTGSRGSRPPAFTHHGMNYRTGFF